MDGNAIEQLRITHEDLANQLVKQLTQMTLEVSAVRAENEKLKQYVTDLLAAQVVKGSK